MKIARIRIGNREEEIERSQGSSILSAKQ